MTNELNRAQRRRLARLEQRDTLEIPEHKKREIAARLEAVERLSRQGISPQDLKQEYDRGFDEGFMSAAMPITKGCYAAVCLALKELYGFGPKRCLNVLRKIDEKLLYTLDGRELIDQVFEDVGLSINFKEPFDRIEEVDRR